MTQINFTLFLVKRGGREDCAAVNRHQPIMTATRTTAQIEADLKSAAANCAAFRRTINEGQGGYIDDTEIERLSAELVAAKAAASPLTTREGIQAEREWAKGQGWTAANLAAANKACLARGYSLDELQAAIKSL